jgi:cytochrome c oxidase subunit 3
MQPREPGLSMSAYQIGMTVALVSITAFFTALVIAYYVTFRGQSNWQRIEVPKLLWLSTGILLVSSLTFESARYALRRARFAQYFTAMRMTLALGIAFLISQLLSWGILRSEGVYVRENPHASMFYSFTGAHGLHLLGGICGLAYVLHRGRGFELWSEHDLRRYRAISGVITLYWHFMGGLWLVLFTLLCVWT